MEPKHVVVAGPDPHALREIAEAFRGLGYHVIPAEDASLAGEALAGANAEYLVLGLGFPRIDLDGLRRAINPASAIAIANARKPGGASCSGVGP